MQELLGSLQATETSFLATLDALIQRNFNLSASPPAQPSAVMQTGQQYQHTLASLRQACEGVNQLANPFASSSEMRQIASVNTDSASMDEIRTRLHHLEPYLAVEEGYDARLANHLVGLLGCLNRLQSLYRDSPSLAQTHGLRTPAQTPKSELPPSPSYAYFPQATAAAASDSYGTLHRQAKILQASRMDRQSSQESTSANVFRAVEEAEVELLWGRIDDMLEALSATSASQASSTEAPPSDGYTFPAKNTRTGVDAALLGPTPKMTSDEAVFGNLPEYEQPAPPGYSATGMLNGTSNGNHNEDRKESVQADDVDRIPARRTSTRHPQYADEKMQIDLDRMTSAIERLYVAAPQLLNQRVAYSPRPLSAASMAARKELREAQLAKLGTAVERLSRGRMEDQRANLTDMPTSAKAKGKKAADNKVNSLERLLQDIDRATKRSLNDQRVAFSPRQHAVLNGARETARAAAVRNTSDVYDHI